MVIPTNVLLFLIITFSFLFFFGGSGQTSMRGEALGPVNAHCPRLGECQDREAGVCALVSSKRGWDRWFLRGNEKREYHL